jgi:hypothetical protein
MIVGNCLLWSVGINVWTLGWGQISSRWRTFCMSMWKLIVDMQVKMPFIKLNKMGAGAWYQNESESSRAKKWVSRRSFDISKKLLTLPTNSVFDDLIWSLPFICLLFQMMKSIGKGDSGKLMVYYLYTINI